MDFSDIIRRNQALTQWTYLKQNTLATQSNCNFSTCTQLSGCAPINYQSYEQKNIIALGKYSCLSCSVSSTAICFLG
jgi:hypothetical protein